MNDRFVEMDNFLRYYSQLYMQNPDLDITYGTFYNALSTYGLSEEEMRNRDIKYEFKNWISCFANKNNINVFWTERQGRFLQFQNDKGYTGKDFKLYLSFPKDKISDCVKKIFSFINMYDMETYSKVADCIRSDSVILRMKNKDDVQKIFDFVNSDKELVTSSKFTNPFLMRNGVVGFAYDDMLSYNSTLCKLFESYFRDCRSNNTLSNISLQNFRDYSNKFYQSIFINRDKIKDFNDFIGKNNRFHSDGMKLVNYEQVFRLINCSLNYNIDIDNYFKYVESFRDEDYNDRASQFYDSLLNERTNNEQDNSNNYDDVNVKDEVNIKQIFDDYVVFALQKYGSIEEVCKYLRSYELGSVKAITRNNDFRQLFFNHIKSTDISKLTNGNIENYVSLYASYALSNNVNGENGNYSR